MAVLLSLGIMVDFYHCEDVAKLIFKLVNGLQGDCSVEVCQLSLSMMSVSYTLVAYEDIVC